MLLKVFHRTKNALTNCETGAPAQAANPGRIEKDKWIVADPSSISTGVLDNG